jgi:DNA-binding CsgD family transcriptional regulator
MDADERGCRIGLLRQLTPREFETFKLTCERMHDRDVAIRLLVTMRTVNLDQGTISSKLGHH